MPGLHTLTRSANRSPYARWHAEAAAGLPRVTLALADLPADCQNLLRQVAQAHGFGYQVKLAVSRWAAARKSGAGLQFAGGWAAC